MSSSITFRPLHGDDGKLVTLTEFIGDPDLDHEIARSLLRKHGGDVEKAANAYFEGDKGEEKLTNVGSSTAVGAWQRNGLSTLPVKAGTPPLTGPRHNSPIDLTGDDDNEMAQAIKASLESHPSQMIQSESESVLVPSQRAPTQIGRLYLPMWKQLGCHMMTKPLSRAIEESLNSSYNDFITEEYEPLPIEKQIREGHRPVVLRPTLPTRVYAALLLQGLFFIPQLRSRVAQWRPTAPPDVVEITVPEHGPEHILWAIMELFSYMEFAILSELDVDAPMDTMETVPWASAVEKVGDLSNQFFTHIAAIVERLFREQSLDDKSRVFHFLYGAATASPDHAQETGIVKVDIDPPALITPFLGDSSTALPIISEDTYGQANTDLISRLSAQLSSPKSPSASQEVILEPSEVVAFQLTRSSSYSSYGYGHKNDKEKGFTYSKSIYLDQFLQENAKLAERKRQEKWDMGVEINKLNKRKETLTHFDNKDSLKDLRASIYYYEHVAQADEGDTERKEAIKRTRGKLERILQSIENEVQTIENKIEQLKKDATSIFDCPELQKHRYDLRAVFVHDGLFGRKHLYSYVHDKGSWWKTVDSLVEEVSEETVLNNQDGLHLGAGPYLLLYSRALSEDEIQNLHCPWPDEVKNTIKDNNKIFLSQLPPELAAKVVLDSPVSSPFLSASDEMAQSTEAEAPISRDELMDFDS